MCLFYLKLKQMLIVWIVQLKQLIAFFCLWGQKYFKVITQKHHLVISLPSRCMVQDSVIAFITIMALLHSCEQLTFLNPDKSITKEFLGQI